MTAGDIISFGPYRLIPAERLLLRRGEAVDVGSRALDVLIALVESAGAVVGQRELMLRAWPNVVVGEGSLRVAIGGLRKALRDGRDDTRYIANVAGRGYSFVAQVDRAKVRPWASTPLAFVSEPHRVPKHRLPGPLARMVGRDDAF
jgi:DNA-binding winged helix-turn-helix (wHTH) protein